MLAYLDCFSGISGDMLLGALVDAGVDLEALRARLATLPLGGFHLDTQRVVQHGLAGTRVAVVVEKEGLGPERTLDAIERLIRAGGLPERARDRSLGIFRKLAEAEARIHGTTVEAVHFHEVGAVDAIVDVVGTALGLELLGIDDLYCSELPLTSGRVRGAHGVLPVPAPAALELLRGTGAGWRPVDVEGELVTPTGAAVLAALARFERPEVRVTSVGYGFGRRELPWANCLRLVVGEAPGTEPGTRIGVASNPDWERDAVAVLEANVDNMTGEALGWLMERLLAAGALDVAYAPLQMKKHRPGTLLMVITEPERAEELAGLVVRESGTLGVRIAEMRRLKAGRRVERIATPLGEARVKLRLAGDEVVGLAAEYEDARALAERHGLPLGEAMARIEAAGRERFGLGGDEAGD
ncbi:MAG TPA: nickel pincer cofactor biosynthesis protein LarC [Ktedonobacterales bacterium]